MEACGWRVVMSYLVKVDGAPTPLTTSEPSAAKPRSRKLSVSLRMTAVGVGAALDGCEQVLLSLWRVFELSPLDGQEQRLVEVLLHQCLRADASRLGEPASAVSVLSLLVSNPSLAFGLFLLLSSDRGLAFRLLLLLLSDCRLLIGVAPLHEGDRSAHDRDDQRRGERSDNDATAAGAHDLVPIDLLAARGQELALVVGELEARAGRPGLGHLEPAASVEEAGVGPGAAPVVCGGLESPSGEQVLAGVVDPPGEPLPLRQ